jgi:trehalose-phosphatase
MRKREAQLAAFFERLQIVQSGLLLLDYDGTLAPFREEREKAYPYQGVEERLSRLAAQSKVRTIIISGRRLSDLVLLLHNVKPLPELWGSHGLERRCTDGAMWTAPLEERLKKALKRAREICTDLAGEARCENKPFGVAFHWRGMSERNRKGVEESLRKEWEALCHGAGLALYPFDGGLEIRIEGIGKGGAVRAILAEISPRTPIAYLGDDQTDEDAFAEIGKRGLKILARREALPSLADIRLNPPEEVLSFLDRCLCTVGV